MGYYLQALIGNRETLEDHVSDFRCARLVSLAHGLAIIPLTDNLYDEIGDGGEIDHFYKLSPGVERWAHHISGAAPLAYIEADFWGGTGGQSAIVWSGGSRVLGPIHSLHAINAALSFLGVQPAGAHDEFAAVGLGRHRDTIDWISQET